MYAMYVMMTYLTNVWKIGFTRAAAIVNVFWGSVIISPLFLIFIVDTILGHYWMLLISSFSFSAVKIDLDPLNQPTCVYIHSLFMCIK